MGVLANSLITCKPKISMCFSVSFHMRTHTECQCNAVALRPLCMGVFVLWTHGVCALHHKVQYPWESPWGNDEIQSSVPCPAELAFWEGGELAMESQNQLIWRRPLTSLSPCSD